MAVNITPQANPDHFGGANVKVKRQTIVTRSGYTAPVSFQIFGNTGAPLDLTQYSLPASLNGESEQLCQSPGLLIRCNETAQAGGVLFNAEIVDAVTGRITFVVPDCIQQNSGIYLLEFAAQAAPDVLYFLTDAYLLVERQLSQGTAMPTGAPSLPEVRMFLRDFGQENELLDAVDFDASEIGLAAELCVSEWNEADPFDGPQFSTNTFPFRRNWLIGMTSYLYGIAVDHYMRNELAKNAGQFAYDDKAKAQIYQQKAMQAKQEWQQFVGSRKTVLTAQGAWQELPGLFSSGEGVFLV